MRVAHHASYVPWLEEARTELLRTSGIAYSQLEAAGVYLAVIGLQIAYKRPALYDDLLDIHVRVASVTRVKIRHEYEVRLAERPAFDLLRLQVGERVLALAALRAGVDPVHERR